MANVYANRNLQTALEGLGPLDRLPKVGERGAETVLTLAVGTAGTGHVQAWLCLDVMLDDGRVIHSIPLAAYSHASMDLAYGDGLLVAMSLGVMFRQCDPVRGWLITPRPGGEFGDDGRGIPIVD